MKLSEINKEVINEQFILSDKQKIANDFNLQLSDIDHSVAHGFSYYINYRGFKVRFSDHSTSAFSERHLDEIQVGVNCSKFIIDLKIDRKKGIINKDNYQKKINIQITKDFAEQQRDNLLRKVKALKRYNIIIN